MNYSHPQYIRLTYTTLLLNPGEEGMWFSESDLGLCLKEFLVMGSWDTLISGYKLTRQKNG